MGGELSPPHRLLFSTCTFPIMHLICPPPSHQILHNLCFSFLLATTAVLREIEYSAHEKFGGANKVLEKISSESAFGGI